MEFTTLVAESTLSSRELAEVARGFWTVIVIELEDDSPGGLGVDCDVKLQAEWGQLVNSDEDVSEGVQRRFCGRKGGEKSSAVKGIQVKGTHPRDM